LPGAPPFAQTADQQLTAALEAAGRFDR